MLLPSAIKRKEKNSASKHSEFPITVVVPLRQDGHMMRILLNETLEFLCLIYYNNLQKNKNILKTNLLRIYTIFSSLLFAVKKSLEQMGWSDLEAMITLWDPRPVLIVPMLVARNSRSNSKK